MVAVVQFGAFQEHLFPIFVPVVTHFPQPRTSSRTFQAPTSELASSSGADSTLIIRLSHLTCIANFSDRHIEKYHTPFEHKSQTRRRASQAFSPDIKVTSTTLAVGTVERQLDFDLPVI